MGYFYRLTGAQGRGMSYAAGAAIAEPLPWRRGVVWLLFLGPFFFLSYGYSNRLAAQSGVTDSLVFSWEQNIPFLPWTIFPYWSIDLFYGLSFLCCRTRQAVDRHALRLLTAQLICVTAFLVFPLHFSFGRPPTEGVFGAMFDALMGFDQPYNQAPSLHIALLVIIWVRFADALPTRWRPLVHAWSALIAVSVLTTFQHHFIDVPTGAAVGLFCLWLWPDGAPSPFAAFGKGGDSRRRRIAVRYVTGAVLLTVIALLAHGGALWLLWGALALAMVGLIYLGPGSAGFQKREGRLSLPAMILLAPYLLGAWLNSRWWTRHRPQADEIASGVWLGRLPTAAEVVVCRYTGVLDLTAELPGPHGAWRYEGLPWLDLVAPDALQLAEAVRRIAALRERGPLLVCCALGYSRSACAAAAWLLYSGQAADVDAAISMLREKRPQVVLSPVHRAALAAFHESCHA